MHADCPRCGDWVVVLLDENGQRPRREELTCDGPHGCGYTWILDDGPSPDLALEKERLLALVEELPEDYWPSWLYYFAQGPCISNAVDSCEDCGEDTIWRRRLGGPTCLPCILKRPCSYALDGDTFAQLRRVQLPRRRCQVGTGGNP